jgi:8-oxo-dGTP pyrophosphatase MutT (NUDIX family)
MSAYAQNHQITDPLLQRAIIDRILREHDPNPIVRPAEYLGPITLPDGKTVGLYLRHAADAILLDDFGQAILITRLHHPGIGKLALPGGFIDGDESAEQAARREAAEETGISQSLLATAKTLAVLPRLYDRPGDIRIAYNNLAGTSIRKGDVMMIPTQGVCLKLPDDFTRIALQAGDDAGSVHIVKIASLDPSAFGIADHLPMLHQALNLLNS